MQSSITQFFKTVPNKENSDTEIRGTAKTTSVYTPPSKRKKPSTSSSSSSESKKKKNITGTKNVKRIKESKSSDEEVVVKNPTIQKKKALISSDEETDIAIDEKEFLECNELNGKGPETCTENKNGNSDKKVSESEDKTINSFFIPSKNSKEIKSEPIIYNPNLNKYHPIDNACWKYKEKVPYLALARTFEEIENTSARLKMIEILSNYFRSVIVLTPEDLLPSIYLCLNELAPAYEGIELGVAGTSLMKAIAQSTGRTLAQIKADAQSTGDLGLVAEQSRNNQRTIIKPAPLTVRGVFERLKEIAKMTGHAV